MIKIEPLVQQVKSIAWSFDKIAKELAHRNELTQADVENGRRFVAIRDGELAMREIEHQLRLEEHERFMATESLLVDLMKLDDEEFAAKSAEFLARLDMIRGNLKDKSKNDPSDS